ncbi:MAG TPA: CARDB domain-containing protein [Gaiellaceae bacterium]|nr:CARDB domain-containing protein [Gaiellaceae bacterium]
MSTHDDDILDFDFFDEGATREDAHTREQRRGAERRAPRRGGPRRPQLRAGSATPLLRLVGLIALAILIVVLLVVWAQGCASDHQRGAYRSYMRDIGTIGRDSSQIGGRLADLLTTVGLKQADLLSQLDGLIQQQQQDVARAQRLDVPGPVRAEHENAIEALQLRASGMQGLSQTFQTTASSRDATTAGRLLSVQAERLLASDVVWSDLFKGPAEKELQNRDVSGVAVPSSVFVSSNDLYDAKSLTLVWRRVHGASTGGTVTGVHGTNIEYVEVQPGGARLGSQETTVKISTALAFVVAVKDGGDSQEVQIQVTLTIPTQPNPIVKTATIPVIDPGEVKTVTFKDFGTLPPGEKLSVKVDVKPVKGEKRTDNNTAEYPILTSL